MTLVFFGPMGEEPGWRGFALPRMLARWSPLRASVLLGMVWAVWHLPLFWIPGSAHASHGFGWFSLAAVSFSVIITWAFLGANRVLLVPILIHGSANILWPDLAPEMAVPGKLFPCVVVGLFLWAVATVLPGRVGWFARPVRDAEVIAA